LLREEKIIYRQTADRIVATIDRQRYLVDKTLHIVLVHDAFQPEFRLEYLLAILNSKLATYVYRALTGEIGRLFAQVKTFVMKRMPIRRIDFADPEEKAMHDRLVALVERMLELHRRRADKTLPQSEREDVEREIVRTNIEIDTLVYDLYGLTEEERRIVEEATVR